MKSHLWVVYALGAVLCWGAWGVVNKVALSRGSWPMLVLGSAVVYVLAAGPFLAWTRAWTAPGPTWGWAVLSAFLAAAGMVLFYASYRGGATPASVVVPFSALYPVVTVALGIWLLRERLSPAQYVGAALAVVAGVLLAFGK
jgi:chloramphenicol-sensitive protein RarD